MPTGRVMCSKHSAQTEQAAPARVSLEACLNRLLLASTSFRCGRSIDDMEAPLSWQQGTLVRTYCFV